MREIKDVYHSQSEREQGLALLHAYQQESTRILNEYCEIEHPLQKRYQSGEITFEEYLEQRQPFWDKYRSDDKRLYEEYVKGATDIGYDLVAE